MASAQNPWQTLEREVVYENDWIRVAENQVINPSGNRGIYGVVHFKSRACGILALDSDDHTWLVGQYRYALGQYSWELPMGGVAHGEALLAGAQRELREETGLTAERWEKILDVDISNSVSDETGHVFVATELTRGEPAFEETEDISIRRLSFDAALAMVESGEIRDLLSAAGILRYACIRGR